MMMGTQDHPEGRSYALLDIDPYLDRRGTLQQNVGRPGDAETLTALAIL